MADECDEDSEWLDYSSSLDLQQTSFNAVHKQEEDGSTREGLQDNLSDSEKLEKVREVLKTSICQTTSIILATPCLPEELSLIKGPCNHWLWEKLVSKLNSIRQPKWDGSCLEDSYHRCLQISINANPEESSEVALDHYEKNLFNFHDIKTISSRVHNGSLSPGNSQKELVNKNELDSTGNFNDERKNSSTSDTSFEDIAPELEWSDNDVKDSIAEPSITTGFNESEAFADLARMSYEEIMSIRNELIDYTKEYSDVLVIELENRDAYIREKELKNDFISSFLAFQAKIREATKLASSKKIFSLQSNSSSNSQSLTTIPYEIQNGGPSSEILEKLIEIMDAMKTDSSNVPTLLTNYILKVLCK